MGKAQPATASKSTCQVCKEHQHKYKCPACHLPYCSVACFKLHKNICGKPNDDSGPSSQPSIPTSTTTTTSNPQPPSPTNLNVSPLPPLAFPDSYRRDDPLPDSLRPLTSLKWPAEPDQSIFLDPLRRDDPKPLQRQELMQIATSSSLRQILVSHPSLKPSLLAISQLEPSLREIALQKCLGLDSTALSGNMAQSVPSDGFFLNEESIQVIAAGESKRGGGRGRGRGRGRGNIQQTRRGRDGVFVGKEEQDELKEFAEVVRVILEDQGEDQRRKMEWNV